MYGKRIQQVRIENKHTQDELSNYLGVSRQTVGNYENEVHQPDYDTLVKISKLYNISTDYLLGVTNIENYKDKLYIDRATMSLDGADPVLKKLLNTFTNILENNQNTEKLQTLDDILKLISKLL